MASSALGCACPHLTGSPLTLCLAATTGPRSGGVGGWGKELSFSVGTQSGPGLAPYVQVRCSRLSVLQNHLT